MPRIERARHQRPPTRYRLPSWPELQQASALAHSWPTPRRYLAAGTAIALAMLTAALSLALATPSLGLSLLPQEEPCPLVGRIWSPSAGDLHARAKVCSLSTPDGPPIELSHPALLTEPGSLPTYERFNAFFTKERELFTVLLAPTQTVELQLQNGGVRSVALPVVPRSLASLPVSFWWLSLLSLVTVVISAGIWGSRRNQHAARLVGLCGLGYGTALTTFSVYSTREIAMDPSWLLVLSIGNGFGSHLFGAAAVSLYAYYPLRLTTFPVTPVLLGMSAFHWIATSAQWIEFPLHTFELPYPFVLTIGGLFAAWQWRRAGVDPVRRACLQWMILSTFLSFTLCICVFFVPNILGLPPLLSASSTIALPFGVFLGFVLAICRYRLFDLERWWVWTWLWFLGGTLVIAVDLLLIYALRFEAVGATAFSLILCGWLYFPLRQLLFTRVLRVGNDDVRSYLPALIDAVAAPPSAEDVRFGFANLLRRVFDASIRESCSANASTGIWEDGLVLRVASIAAGPPVELVGRNQGRRLFSPSDERLAKSLRALTQQACIVKTAAEEASRTERRTWTPFFGPRRDLDKV
jgi:hypothetical protein